MSVTIGFERGALIVLPVRFRHDTEARVRMVLDTGAVMSLVRPELAEEIGLGLVEDPDDELIGVAGSASVFKGKVRSVSVLGQEVRDLTVVAHGLHPALTIDGILGMDFLQHFNIRIDNDTQTVTIEPRKETTSGARQYA